MKGASITKIIEYQGVPGETGAAIGLARALLLGVEGYPVQIVCEPGTGPIALNPELALICADRVCVIARYGCVIDLVLQRFIKSRSGRDGTIDRIGPASSDFVLSGYRRRLTSEAHIVDVIGALDRVSGGPEAWIGVSDTSEPLQPILLTANLAALMADGLRLIATDPLVTVLTVGPEERLTWRAARYLTLRHYPRPPEDETDPLRHYLSFGRFSFGSVCRLLESAGVPVIRKQVVRA